MRQTKIGRKINRRPLCHTHHGVRCTRGVGLGRREECVRVNPVMPAQMDSVHYTGTM